MSPKRIQLRRTKGWRKPEGAVVVSRPSAWGNNRARAVRVSDDKGARWDLYLHSRVTGMWDYDRSYRFAYDAAEAAVAEYREDLDLALWLPSIQERLAGHDLACWCPLDQPCHADVLLELANRQRRTR